MAKLKTIINVFVGAVLAIGAGIAYFFGTRRRNTDSRGIQDIDRVIDDGRELTESSQTGNRIAKEHADAAGKNIDDAIESVATAKDILRRAKERAKK